MSLPAARVCMGVALGLMVAVNVVVAQKPSGDEPTQRLFFRLVGAENNAPLIPKSRSAWTQDRRLKTSSTGSADLGFTEYPFCNGVMDFTFVEGAAVYPRLVSDANADLDRINTADLVADHVYQPDGCVWGWEGREFIQTFTATKSELVSLTLMVASEPGTFVATLLEGGPGGRQIGQAKTFVSGHSLTWGRVRWLARQAPLVPGHTYGIRVVRADGEPWIPYLHSAGNAYDGGIVYLDGQPRPEADLAAWIVEQPDDLHRGLIVGTDAEGWVHRASRVTFSPRSANVRLLSLTVSPVTVEEMGDGYLDMVVRVRRAGEEEVLHRKRCLAVGPPEGAQTAHFLFASGEFPTGPGESYDLDAYFVPHKQAALRDQEPASVPKDMRLQVYGEPAGRPLPAIYNLALDYSSESGFQRDAQVTFRWSSSRPATTVIQTWGDGKNNGVETTVEEGTSEVRIRDFWPGHRYRFRLRATDARGATWKTPLYEIRIPRTDEIGSLRQEEYPAEFVTLAARQVVAPSRPNVIRYREQVPLENGDFEGGLRGWQNTGETFIDLLESEKDLGVKWGRKMAGWTHRAEGPRLQALAKGALYQRIATKPGHHYLLSVWARTEVLGGMRGNTRVRLSADPTGGTNFDANENTSPTYWTDGKWKRLEHRWRAAGERSTIALNLFRWWDLPRSSAHVDHVTVYDLGPVVWDAADPVPMERSPVLVLANSQEEITERVEGFVSAPPGMVITGLGSRAQDDNITTMWLQVQPLMPDGSLGAPEQIRAGWEPDAGLEAKVVLPAGHVATGFGAGIAPEWDLKRLRVWARPLAPDGSLGEQREFRGGVDLESGVERQLIVPEGRVLTSAGLNCMLNDVNRIRGESARIIRRVAAEDLP